MFEVRRNGRQGRVLVVDDDAGVRRPITERLTRAGYEVVEAEDGDQAIKKLREGDNPLMVDTILCDIRMPKIGGTEAIAYFKAQYPSVPILVLTGYPDVELASTLMRQGVMDYMVKPISTDKVLSAIRTAVDQHEILKDQFVV